MKIRILRAYVFFISNIAFFITLLFAHNSYANYITIDVERISKLPIHAYENRSSIANVVAIIGGNGLKNKHGKSRNFLVRTKEKFKNNLINYYLFPNYNKREKASYEFRVSAKRVERIFALLEVIKKRNNKPIFIAGFSRGSVDAGKIAKIYPDGISGIILASGIYTNFSKKAEFYSMQIIIGESVQVPTLIVHHTDDDCIATPFYYAKKFYRRLKAPSKMLFAYSDGLTNGGECGPFNHHGFEGLEQKVAGDIASWIISMSKTE